MQTSHHPCPRCDSPRAVADADDGLRCHVCNALLVAFAPREEHVVRFYALDGRVTRAAMTKRPLIWRTIEPAHSTFDENGVPQVLVTTTRTWERLTYAYGEGFVGPWRDPDYYEQAS